MNALKVLPHEESFQSIAESRASLRRDARERVRRCRRADDAAGERSGTNYRINASERRALRLARLRDSLFICGRPRRRKCRDADRYSTRTAMRMVRPFRAGMPSAARCFAASERARTLARNDAVHFSCFSDGKNPHGGVVRDARGNLYGTTTAGGLSRGCTGEGCGVIFKLASNGSESVLYTFQGKNDGFGPGSPLAFDRAGNLYGIAPGAAAKLPARCARIPSV